MRYSDQGYILKKTDILNEDSIIQLFLKDKGKISCIAKGIKKLTSKKASKLEMLNQCQFSIAEGKNLDIILEVQLLENFPNVKSSSHLLFVLFYIDELIDKTVYAGEVCNDVYALLGEILYFLNTNPKFFSKNILLYFNGKLLKHLGVFPELFNCLICKKKMRAEDLKCICTRGISHTGCYRADTVSNDAIKTLRFIEGQSLQNFMKLKVTEQIINSLFSLTMIGIEDTIGSHIKSKSYIS